MTVVLGSLLPFVFWGLWNVKSKVLRVVLGLGFLSGMATLVLSGQQSRDHRRVSWSHSVGTHDHKTKGIRTPGRSYWQSRWSCWASSLSSVPARRRSTSCSVDTGSTRVSRTGI